MRAIGLMGGIGSMLIGVKRAGFEIVANIEHRKDFQTGTFEYNFSRPMFNDITVAPKVIRNIDLAVSHPACGAFSALNMTGKNRGETKGDIPKLIEWIKNVKPRYFAIDNLPKMLLLNKVSDFTEVFHEYDLFFEFVHNYGYGNCQLRRDRLFIIGALKSEKFVFKPNETDVKTTVKDVIGDLKGKYSDDKKLQHFHHVIDCRCTRASHLKHRGDKKVSWREVRDYFVDKPPGFVLMYHSKKGGLRRKPGFKKTHWKSHGHTIIGSNPQIHPHTNVPLTPREKMRIMGYPDTFILRGVVLEKDGKWDHQRNLKINRQIGRAVPVEFVEYLARQIRAHIEGKKWKASGIRLRRHKLIDKAKKEYCKIVGKTKSHCKACWLTEECKL